MIDAMRALRRTQVLPPKIPASIHQLDGIQRASPFPRRRGGVRRFSVEKILHGDESAPFSVPRAIRRRKLRFHVRAQDDIHILEHSCSNIRTLSCQAILPQHREQF